MKKQINWKNIKEVVVGWILVFVLFGGIGFLVLDKILGFIVKYRLLF